MAGISEDKNTPGLFTAYIVRHTTGEALGVQQFTNVFEAIRTINEIPRNWAFESTKSCGGNCANGKCAIGGGCGKKKSATPSASAEAKSQTEECGPCSS